MRHIIKNGRVTRRGVLTGGLLLSLSALLSGSLGLAKGNTPAGAVNVGASKAGALKGDQKSAWNPAFELAVSFTTSASSTGQYESPYVAVWIENASGVPVRTLGLWMLNTSRGIRYLSHLSRWVNAAQSAGTLAGTQTSPTRMAGTYTLVWDGKDDKKVPLPQGDYVLCIESARHDGPYSLLEEKISVGAVPFKKTLPPDGELTDVSVEFRKHS
jgi:hypothetical protein